MMVARILLGCSYNILYGIWGVQSRLLRWLPKRGVQTLGQVFVPLIPLGKICLCTVADEDTQTRSHKQTTHSGTLCEELVDERKREEDHKSSNNNSVAISIKMFVKGLIDLKGICAKPLHKSSFFSWLISSYSSLILFKRSFMLKSIHLIKKNLHLYSIRALLRHHNSSALRH